MGSSVGRATDQDVLGAYSYHVTHLRRVEGSSPSPPTEDRNMILQESEETLQKFHVDTSTIPGAGRGVFARIDLKKGEALEILGVKVKHGSLEDSCTRYAYHYKFFADSRENSLIPVGFGGMVNQATTVRKVNAHITQTEGKVYYVLIRDVKAGEEILGWYGPNRNDCRPESPEIKTKMPRRLIPKKKKTT